MRMNLRCCSATITPSDTSGVMVEVEVASWREVVSELDENVLRFLMGDERFEAEAARCEGVIKRALKEFDESKGEGTQCDDS